MNKPKLWDLLQERLFINILQTDSILGGFENIEVKVRVIVDGKKVYSTKPRNLKTNDAVIWKEIFFIKSSPNVLFQIKSSDTVLYECNKPFNDCIPEIIYEDSLQLNPVYKKKTSQDAKLKIRFVLSTSPKFRAGNENMDIIDIHQRSSKLKPEFGDLLLYSGLSMLDTFSKVESGLLYTSVGYILELPNKYTNEMELYVLEITQNLNNNIDNISETKKIGVCLFKFEERIHSYPGSSVHLKKCTQSIDSDMREKIVDFVLKLHSENEESSTYDDLINKVKMSTEKIKLVHEYYKEKNDREKIMDFLGPNFVAKVLQHIGWIKDEQVESSFGIEELLNLEHYKNGQLILLRTLKSTSEYFKDKLGEDIEEVHVNRYFLNFDQHLPSNRAFQNQLDQINSYKELFSGRSKKKEAKKEAASKSKGEDVKKKKSR